MKEDSRLMFEIAELTLHSLNGTLDNSSLRRLEQLLEGNSQAVEYYQEILWTHVGLISMEGISYLQNVESSLLDNDFWQTMLREEKTAPKLEIPQEGPQRELIQKVLYSPREKRRLSTFSKVMLVVNAAAILFIILFLKLAPSKGSVEVATLTGSINAKWAEDSVFFEDGARVKAGNENLFLEKGYAELLFDNQTKVTIEAPAEFKIISQEQIQLSSGRIYATVPFSGIGFMVTTASAKVIDLGTEFGVQVDMRGDTELHVVKGKTSLITGDKVNKASQIVIEKTARRIRYDNSAVSDISCQEDMFVREIDPETGFVWRGQALDLADVVVGGNGFGTGRKGYGLDFNSGQLRAFDKRIDYRSVANKFVPVPDNAFIDGIFIPDGGAGEVTISSTGLVFQGCPDTDGTSVELFGSCGWIPSDTGLYNELCRDFLLDGVQYGVSGAPSIGLWGNRGITFNLEAMREAMPEVEIKNLSGLYGYAQNVAKVYKGTGNNPKADLSILLDGKVVFSREQVTIEDGVIPVNVEIDPSNRFLSIIATDGSDSRANDWVLLARPQLELESKEN